MVKTKNKDLEELKDEYPKCSEEELEELSQLYDEIAESEEKLSHLINILSRLCASKNGYDEEEIKEILKE